MKHVLGAIIIAAMLSLVSAMISFQSSILIGISVIIMSLAKIEEKL